jgi:RNA polymerase sigma factor (sigma-70 family)
LFEQRSEESVLEVGVAEPGTIDASGPPAAPASTRHPLDDTEEVYRAHFPLLLYVARGKFHVPEADAEGLIHEIFLSYMAAVPAIRNVRAWLVAAVSNASRHYWRVHGRTQSLPDDFSERSDPLSHGLAETLALRLTVRQTLGNLREKCRETLRLHYFEGLSAGEVARHFDTTNRYAEKLIHNCLRRAHEIYLNLTAVRQL